MKPKVSLHQVIFYQAKEIKTKDNSKESLKSQAKLYYAHPLLVKVKREKFLRVFYGCSKICKSTNKSTTRK